MILQESRTRRKTRYARNVDTGKEELVEYDETYYVNKEHREDLITHDNSLNLYNFPDSCIQPGQFTIPFSLKLPENLPTSFEHTWDSDAGKCTADIKYSLQAYIMDVYNNPLVQTIKKFYLDQQPLHFSTLHGDFKQEDHDITTCCCIKRGQINTKVFTEKNGYVCGQGVTMVVECVNNCSKDIKGIYADFVKTINVRAQSESKTLSDTTSGLSGGMIVAGGRAINENAKRISVSTAHSINQSLEGTKYHTSCAGNLIQCNYHIQARFSPDVCCNCSGDPTSSFPVFMTVPNMRDETLGLAGFGNNIQNLQPNENQNFNRNINYPAEPQENREFKIGEEDEGF